MMKRTLKLQTSDGNKVRIVLDNWGSGWIRQCAAGDLGGRCDWQCMDSAEIAQESCWGRPKVLGARNLYLSQVDQ